MGLCVFPGGGSASAADLVRVGTPEGTAFMFAVLDVGTGAGIFAKHDLTVEKINFAGGGKLQEGVTSGAVDLTVSGNTDLAFVAKGVPAKGVAVTTAAPVEMSVIIRSDGDITQISDLKGKTIGVTSPTSLTSWLALALARREGWGPEGLTRAYIGSMNSEVAGLLVKNVDAIVGPVEGAYLLEAKGQAKPLTTFGDMKVFITHVIYASDALIKDHPDQVRRFLAAWFETVRYMRAHKDETIRLTEPVTRLPPDIASKVYDLETPALSLTGHFDPEAVAVVMQSFVDLGVLDSMPGDKILYTEAFLP
jgi:ABC-type nitrate/sulfonate/bicarbonate transport system substrate-binding protein